MRTKAREVVFKLVFSSRFTEDISEPLKKSLYEYEKLNGDDVKYVERVLGLINEHEQDISKVIDEKSLSFPEARLFPADKSILSVALAEMLYMNAIPRVVSANEAANMASAYSTEKSATFISGILAEVIKN